MIDTSENKLVLFMNTTKKWGGGEKWHLDTAIKLRENNFSVHIVCSIGSELEKKSKIYKIPFTSISISNFSYLNIFAINRFVSTIQLLNPSIIILNASKDLKFGGIAAKMASVPRVIYRRGSAIPIKNHIVNRLLFRNAITDILANSEETKKTINANFSIFPSDKIKVIYNGIDINSLQLNTSTEKLVIPSDDELIIGNAGRLVPQKSQKDLIEMARILKSFGIPFKLLIAGSGPLEKSLKSLTNKYKLESEVVFLGFVNDMKAFYNSLDLFVLSSTWEGFGYVLAEAMFYQIPVLAYEVSSNPELISNNKTGYLVESGNYHELALKCKELFYSKNKRTELGINGKKKVEKYFDAEKNFEQLLRFLT